MSNDDIIKLISTLFQIYNLLLFARIISSWFPIDRASQLYRLLYMATEPVLTPFRDIFHRFGLMKTGLDLSPIAAFFVLNLIRNLIIRMLL
jgi:YggT family protein